MPKYGSSIRLLNISILILLCVYPRAHIHVSQYCAYKETCQITNNVTHHNDENLQNKTILLNQLEI